MIGSEHALGYYYHFGTQVRNGSVSTAGQAGLIGDCRCHSRGSLAASVGYTSKALDVSWEQVQQWSDSQQPSLHAMATCSVAAASAIVSMLSSVLFVQMPCSGVRIGHGHVQSSAAKPAAYIALEALHQFDAQSSTTGYHRLPRQSKVGHFLHALLPGLYRGHNVCMAASTKQFAQSWYCIWPDTSR